MQRIIFLFSFLFLLTFSLSAQKMKTNKWRQSERDSMEKAQHFFDEHHYDIALRIFEVLQKYHPNEDYLKYITAITGLHRPDMHEKALLWLDEIYKKNKKTHWIKYYLAEAYHLNYKFDEALKFSSEFKVEEKKIPAAELNILNHIEDYCRNGKELMANPKPAKITNLGAVLNTNGSEYAPVITPDENLIMFTYVGEQSFGGYQNYFNEPDPMGIYFEDVFISERVAGEWVKAHSMGETFNTNLHEAPITLTGDGQTLFMFRDDRSDGGDIYSSRLNGISWSVPIRLRGEVNTLNWEGSCSLSPDGKTLYFASDRGGGLGGRDIYKAHLMPDSSWGNVMNLGDKINTKFDDDAPFIHPDGRTLIFSSKGHNSMGDYDIFQTNYNYSDSSWSKPENLGYPINTPDDDRYYVLSGDGKRGYYASGKAGGQGLHDLYVVEPGISNKTVLAILKGKVTLDDKPIEAEILVDIVSSNKQFSTFRSNSTTGNYLISLPAGEDYKITFRVNGFPDQVVNVEVSKAVEYFEKIANIPFLSKLPSDTSGLHPIAANDPNLKPKEKEIVKEEPKINPPSNVPKEGLLFRVQIAAYRLPDNYSYKHLSGLGDIDQLNIDGIVRFTIGGNFNTLDEANLHLGKVRGAGQGDAFVTAIYNGKRVYLEELEKLGLIPPRNK